MIRRITRLPALVMAALILAACQPNSKTADLTATATLPTTVVSPTEEASPALPPHTPVVSTIPVPLREPTSVATATGTPFPIIQETAGAGGHPTLADLWSGAAEFVVEEPYTGLPMGESDTIVMGNGEFWSFLHSSSQHASGAVDQCGDPVAFPGCTVLYRSYDGGRRFQHQEPPVCLFECLQCPCDNETDHVAQQQYPQVVFDGEQFYLVYEFQGKVMLRRSSDGLSWSRPEQVAQSGIWKTWLRPCPTAERIGRHPFVPYEYECLAGGPPGIFVEGDELYVFLAVGQSPGGMGCYRGPKDADAGEFEPCAHNPLFSAAVGYGPQEATGPSANPYFDFRTISSATIQKTTPNGETRYYMLYEGVRGPGPGDLGDTQFGLGMARSMTDALDGPWEKFPGNPLLVPLPGNVGLGHSDLVVHQGRTILYTSLDGELRSRLVLTWR